MRYSLGLVVCPPCNDFVSAFTSHIERKRFVILPKLTGVENTFETFVRNDVISDWLLSDMASSMEKYALTRSKALALIEGGEDRFMEGLKSVYTTRFDDRILEPLKGLP